MILIVRDSSSKSMASSHYRWLSLSVAQLTSCLPRPPRIGSENTTGRITSHSSLVSLSCAQFYAAWRMLGLSPATTSCWLFSQFAGRTWSQDSLNGMTRKMCSLLSLSQQRWCSVWLCSPVAQRWSSLGYGPLVRPVPLPYSPWSFSAGSTHQSGSSTLFASPLSSWLQSTSFTIQRWLWRSWSWMSILLVLSCSTLTSFSCSCTS